MSKLRSISTSIWADTWFEELTPTDKLIFIYLLTNERTNMLGVYEISLKKISFDTGISISDVSNAFEGFVKDKKALYKDNYVVLLNFLKHQSFNSNMKKSAIDVFNELPNSIKPKGITKIKERNSEGFERLCKGFGILSKVEVEVEDEKEGEGEEEINLDHTLNEYKTDEALQAWKDWLLYKKERDEIVNKQQQMHLKPKLNNLARNPNTNQIDESLIPKIIHECIANGWKQLQLTETMDAKLKKYFHEQNN